MSRLVQSPHICHLCNKPKTEIPVKMKLDQTLTEYLICLECKPLVKEFNEADLITDELMPRCVYMLGTWLQSQYIRNGLDTM